MPNLCLFGGELFFHKSCAELGGVVWKNLFCANKLTLCGVVRSCAELCGETVFRAKQTDFKGLNLCLFGGKLFFHKSCAELCGVVRSCAELCGETV